MSLIVMIKKAKMVHAWDKEGGWNIFLGQVTYHAMSKCEVAEGGLTPEEKDGSVSPTKQGVPWGVGEVGMFIDKSF